MQENKELYFGYFKHISQNIIFNDYVNLLPLNSYPKSCEDMLIWGYFQSNCINVSPY